MVKCLICGIEKEFSIKDHLKWTHGLNKEKYQKLYPNAEVTSDKQKKLVSERNKKMWDNIEFKEKMCESRKISHNTIEFKEKMSKISKKRHIENPEFFSGFTSFHKTEAFKEWVVSEERIQKIRESSKKRWENIEYRKKTIQSIKNTLSDGRCKKSKEFRERMSELMCDLYDKGSLTNNTNRYNCGWFINKDGENFYYASKYELNAMIFFDNSDKVLKWTNKHKIRIKYIHDGIQKNYLPDFLVKLSNGVEYIIEMKGWVTDEVIEKVKKSIELFEDKYQIFYNNEDLEKFINEKC